MELFPDRAYVRLKSRVRRTFLHADQDGRGVSLSGRRASVNTAWQVHRVQRDGNDYVLLHSPPTAGTSPSRPAVQNIYDTPQQVDIAWETIEVGDHVVLLLHVSNRLLRANGRYCRWNNGVSVDDVNNQSTTMHWKVEAIPPRAEPPALPFSPAVPLITDLPDD